MNKQEYIELNRKYPEIRLNLYKAMLSESKDFIYRLIESNRKLKRKLDIIELELTEIKAKQQRAFDEYDEYMNSEYLKELNCA